MNDPAGRSADGASELTGTQKAAVVLMNMDHAQAAAVLKQFSELEAEEIAGEIVRMQRVDADVIETTIAEFHEASTRGRRGARGGAEFAAGLLQTSFGAERAAGVMKRVTSSMAGKSFEFLESAEPNQIVSMLEGEMAQTIALVIAHLGASQASHVLSGLADGVRTDVVQRIATMTSATPEALAMVAAAIKSQTVAVVSPRNAAEVVGGIQPLVDIINRANAVTERAILAGLDASDPDLAEEIRSRLLTFADIVRLESRDIQLVLRSVEIPVLAIAIKGSTDLVQQKINENLSERNRDMLRDEVEIMGAVRMSQIDDARAEVVRAIRELEEAGTITVHRGDEDALVE
jgi:flagellar motor switch protein FliG